MIGTYSTVTDAVIYIYIYRNPLHSESYTKKDLVIMCCFYVHHHVWVNKLLLIGNQCL